MEEDFPYQAEYAKSNRSKCKSCKGSIAKESLRLAAMVQSPMFDAKVPNWYHYMCFFGKQRPKTVTDVAHYDSLRWEDQQRIKDKIDNPGVSAAAGGKKGKKGAAAAGGGMQEFTAEYAKSSRAMCRGCEEKILKGEVRISKKDYDSESSRMYGPKDLWHHVECFIKKRDELECYEGADQIPGFNTLSADDKKMLREKIKKMDGKRKAAAETNGVSVKKIKTDETDGTNKQNDEVHKQQNIQIFHYRDNLNKELTKAEMASLLEHNDQHVPSGESRMLDSLSDQLTFGSLVRCTICDGGSFKYESGKGYVCQGNLTEWTKCTNVTTEPQRTTFKIPKEFMDVAFLKKYKGGHKSLGSRVVIVRQSSTAEASGSQQNTNSMMTESTKPLEGMTFVLVGKLSKGYPEIKEQIRSLGGEVSTSVKEKTTAVITTPDCVAGTDKKVLKAKDFNIQCISEDFLEEVNKGGALLMIQKKNICSWGGNPEDRVLAKVPTKSITSKTESRFTKSMPAKLKLKLKGGAVVDPDSELENEAHVYQKGNKIYNCVLGMVDIVRGINSYYKLQLIEDDRKNRCWVFRSWGRIGTTIGNNKLEEMEDIQDCIRQFEGIYEDKTGNRFNTTNFVKHPGKWYPLDIDYGQDDDDNIKKPITAGSKSKLAKPIQELISLIFDIDSMKNAMLEFEIDLKKMPLGKLSKKQIQDSYKVLSGALDNIKLLEDKDDKEATSRINALLLDCSNRFYTLIPHDFGMKQPPILNNIDIINAKITMLDNLREIELAYNLLKSEDDDDVKTADPIDKYYHKLKSKIDVVKKDSDTFKLIKNYVKNTHAATHNHYSLDVQEVFDVSRQGEAKRFKPFKKLHNRQLLWHGSRLTNFAGILSQGLRIAPPEAPVTGYMFGKGVYFADMVSKSANYCCTSRTNPTGLLLLCDVALGNMYERSQSDYIDKLPKGMHSTKGIGQTCPDPKDDLDHDGMKVPCGKGVNTNIKNSTLLYNEYIVYDIAQVNIKYIIKAEFKQKF